VLLSILKCHSPIWRKSMDPDGSRICFFPLGVKSMDILYLADSEVTFWIEFNILFIASSRSRYDALCLEYMFICDPVFECE
jgi:hypothetical protein